MKPLAYLMRPKSFDDIVGQDNLVGPNGVIRKMVDNNHLFSFILYGNPGCGKTTIALATCEVAKVKYFKFNASTDSKDILKQIINEARFCDTCIVIVDEIHRMKKDIQDYLLPFVEDGTLIMIGLTTVNPYHSVNPAIRSRCHIYRINDLDKKAMNDVLNRAIKFIDKPVTIDDDARKYIIDTSNLEIRTLINNFETIFYASDGHITLELAQNCIQKANISIDADGDSYYDTLSGLQKSIRGSDPNGAMYYFAKLIEYNDIESLERRVLVCAYEDVGLANPNACMRTVAAFQAARTVGFPEARIPIASAIIDLCLSPKSKSSEAAIDAALASLRQQSLPAPEYLRLTPVGLEEDEKYNYDRPELWEYIQYLPDQIANNQFYVPWMTSQYEKALAENYRRILKHGRTSNIKKLNHTKKS